MNQHEINKKICSVLNKICIANQTYPDLLDELRDLIKMVMRSEKI